MAKSGASKVLRKTSPTGNINLASANFFGVPKDVRDASKRQYKAGTPRETNDPYTDKDADLIRKHFKQKRQSIMDELKKLPRKATEDSFNELHYLVTEDFLHRIKSGEATTQDLKAACDWLKTNDITGVAYEGSPLDKLNKLLPTVDPTLVQRKVYGKNF